MGSECDIDTDPWPLFVGIVSSVDGVGCNPATPSPWSGPVQAACIH